MTLVANCGHDEHGRYTGGQAGDQTGREWERIGWYSYPWNVVLWHPDEKVRDLMAELADKAARNDCIGYDQGGRYSFWQQLKAAGFDPSAITVPCEADCSSGVAAIVKATGYLLGIDALKNVSIYCYTGNLRAALRSAGFVERLDAAHINSSAHVPAGAVWLSEGNHTTIQITPGAELHDEIPEAESAHSVTYCAYAGGRWLPEVTDLQDYAGLTDKPIFGLAIRCNHGKLKYKAHWGGRWGNWMWSDDYDTRNALTGFCGDLSAPIDGLQVYYCTPDGEPLYEAEYRVGIVGRSSYYEWQHDIDVDITEDGYAGDLKNPIDQVQIHLVRCK